MLVRKRRGRLIVAIMGAAFVTGTAFLIDGGWSMGK